MGNCITKIDGGPPRWAKGIPELEELREKKNPNLDFLYERPQQECPCLGCMADCNNTMADFNNATSLNPNRYAGHGPGYISQEQKYAASVVVPYCTFYYHPPQKQWYWSSLPVTKAEVECWWPVETDRVPRGFLGGGKKAHPKNRIIINYLAAHNPDPTEGKKWDPAMYGLSPKAEEKTSSVKRTIEITPEGKKIIEEVTKPDGTKTVTETLERAQ